MLTTIRETVGLSAENDLLPSQWAAIQAPLAAMALRLNGLLDQAGERHLGCLNDPRCRRSFNAFLGKIDLALSTALGFFDTFTDMLSQRHMPGMGVLLRGCDAIAYDALHKNHPLLATLERPLVFLDRGFGASTLRQGIALGRWMGNPLQTIQIPYTKVREKTTLTSIVHEAGHAAMVRLQLKTALADIVDEALVRVDAADELRKLFRLWMSEIGPDVWGFCNSGVGMVISSRNIQSLTPEVVMRISPTDPHPPAYLRVLLGFECCRQQWGVGEWDDWSREWKMIYPLSAAKPRDRRLLSVAERFLPEVVRALLRGPLHPLHGRSLTSLFDLDSIAPARLEVRIRRAMGTGVLDLSGLTPCGQLATLVLLDSRHLLSPWGMDRLLSHWLQMLAAGSREESSFDRPSQTLSSEDRMQAHAGQCFPKHEFQAAAPARLAVANA